MQTLIKNKCAVARSKKLYLGLGLTEKARMAEKKPAPNRRDSAKPSTSTVKTKSSPSPKTVRRPKTSSNDRLKILFIASECAPFAKTGGLGDVVPGLSKALLALGHEVRIILPLYSCIDRDRYKIQPLHPVCVHMGRQEENWICLHESTLDGNVPVWFVEYDRFFGRNGLYDDLWGEYQDNAFRFALLCKAALQVCKDANFIPDIMHLHDWQTAPAAAFLKTWDLFHSPLSSTASVLTIHNIGYQGVYHSSAFGYFGIGEEHFAPNKFEDHGKINLLKAGVHFADAITTVSPSHAQEILDPSGGKGLAQFLNDRRHDFTGILNGADYEHWNPENDPLLPANYSAQDLRGKIACKSALQKRMGLEVRPDLPIFGIVSRFVHQKGFELIREVLAGALKEMVIQCVVLGAGDSDTERYFHELTASHPGRVGSFIGFSNELAHLIEAGSDFFLMPSLYEPCGLNQIYSMKYGTLPLVRATGGLEDTVISYHEFNGAGTGFKFHDPIGAALYYTLGLAVSTWYDRPHHIAAMRQSAMKVSFPWSTAATQYLEVYRKAIRNRRA